VRLFEWRCNYNIKVIDLRSLALCP
jgi:hypothetical protein